MSEHRSVDDSVAAIAANVIAHPIERAAAIVDHLLPFVSDNDHILDIGAGGCRVTQQLSYRARVNVTPIDVVQWNETDDFYLHIYDGEVLPFEDKVFDTSLLIFVLHHAANGRRVLSEAIRVTQKRIIVVEDTPVGEHEHTAWKQLDRALNYDRHDDIDLAHGIRTSEEWHEVFHRIGGLTVAHQEEYRSPALTGNIYPHTQFVLDIP